VYVRRRVAHLPAFVVAMEVHLVIADPRLLPTSRAPALCDTLQRETRAMLLIVGRKPGDPGERERFLEAGADEYLLKPADPGEIMAHVHAVLRRHVLASGTDGRERLPVTATLSLDLEGQRLVGHRQEVALSRLEFRLLAYLVQRAGAAVSREELLRAVWGRRSECSPREVDVYVRYLRQKLEPDPVRPRHLVTVWGRGYRYQGPAAPNVAGFKEIVERDTRR
jgi:DNA-binding response OmpR family regulator